MSGLFGRFAIASSVAATPALSGCSLLWSGATRRCPSISPTSFIRRDRNAEREAGRLLKTLGTRAERDWRSGGTVLTVPAGRFEALVHELTATGWRVLVEGVTHRTSTGLRANVRSGVDWFDLEVG